MPLYADQDVYESPTPPQTQKIVRLSTVVPLKFKPVERFDKGMAIPRGTSHNHIMFYYFLTYSILGGGGNSLDRGILPAFAPSVTSTPKDTQVKTKGKSCIFMRGPFLIHECREDACAAIHRPFRGTNRPHRLGIPSPLR